jgi:hypothetical protein
MSAPSLLLFYHIHRTGGTTLKNYLSQNAATTPDGLAQRLDRVVPFYSVRCWLQAHRDVFNVRRHNCSLQAYAASGSCDHPSRLSPATRADCASLPIDAFDWRRQRLAVEFHEESMGTFWSVVHPHLPALRAKYAALGGSLQTAVLVRDPYSHATSAFRYRPPHRKMEGRRGVLAYSFADWLAEPGGGEGLQAGWLSGGGEHDRAGGGRLSTHATNHDGFRNRLGCDAVLGSAVARLAAFDIVGVSGCLPALFSALEQRLRWAPMDSEAERSRRMRDSSGRTLAVSQVAYVWLHNESGVEWWRLNVTDRARVEKALRCDGALYAAAERRAAETLGAHGCREAAPVYAKLEMVPRLPEQVDLRWLRRKLGRRAKGEGRKPKPE